MRTAATIGLIGNLAFGAALAAATSDGVPAVPPPKSWQNFTILVWQTHTDVVKDRAIYDAIGIHGFHIDRRNGSEQAFAKETGWPFYVDHAADKGYLHLRELDAVTRKRDIVVRPHSLADPETIAAMEASLRENIGAAKGSSAVGYAFDDETSLGNFCWPVEADGGARSVEGYHRVLAEDYPTIAALNAEYGTSFKDFAEIQPESFEAFRREVGPKGAIAKLNLSRWCDWRAAMDTQFADVLAELTRYANALDPATPAGIVGGQSPAAFGGYDYRKLAKSLQWIEAYDIGGTNEILRSFWGQQRPRVQTFFSSGDPKSDSWFLWYYLCQGNRAVIAWPVIDSQNKPWFADGRAADFIAANADTFKEVQGPVSKLIVDGEFAADPVAIYYSQPSIQVGWALDAAIHGGTWQNRSSSMDAGTSSSGLSRVAWLKSLQDVGVQPTFIHQDELLAGELGKRHVKVLVLNRALCLSDAEADAVRAFAKSGGTVIADDCCGIFDGHGKARATGALDELFGVERDLGRGWFDGNAVSEINAEAAYDLQEKNWAIGAPRHEALAVVELGLKPTAKAKGEAADGTHVLVKNGKAVYLNVSPIGYLLKRSEDATDAWRATLTGLLKDAGVTPRVAIARDGKPARRVEALFWKNGDRTTMCVVENLDRRATIDSFGTTKGALGAKGKLAFTFAKGVKDLRNERTGKALGAVTTFEDEFTPWQANVYSFAN